MQLQKKAWQELSSDVLSIKNLRALYPFADGFRLSENGHPSGAKFLETVSLPCTIFVIHGSITFAAGANSVRISSDEYAELPSGSYSCSIDNDGVQFVRLLKLPEHMRSRSG